MGKTKTLQIAGTIVGKDGATFTPHVAEDGTLSWTNDKELENPASTNLVQAVVAALPVYSGETEIVDVPTYDDTVEVV